jgi:hypothetical protein
VDIGTEEPAIIVEPAEDSFRVPAPAPERVETPVETPERVPAGA